MAILIILLMLGMIIRKMIKTEHFNIPYLTYTKYLTILIILPVAVTVEGVIGGEEDMCAIGNTERVEYLSTGYLIFSTKIEGF